MNNAEKLKTVYAAMLAKAISEKPLEYSWHISELEAVLKRMNEAIDRMSFNKDSPAWRLTCKELGIKHTYQAIKAFKEGN